MSFDPVKNRLHGKKKLPSMWLWLVRPLKLSALPS